MISLDSRRQGDVLMLRKSMIKFEGSDSCELEICGSGTRALPFFLNRQLIKILEDLNVPAQVFLDLQQEQVERLRAIAQAPSLAALFLESADLPKSANLPWLINFLWKLGFHYSNDEFLRQTVELAVLVKLHDLKYRSRILVDRAATLYGIMDETGLLGENEIYCPIINGMGRRTVIVGERIVVTRSPALHPGDVQLVNAVDVPKDSPLNDLYNCVVFSQKGDRDLASKLSGGDLDGDLFQVVWDERLRPGRLAAPADYHRAFQAPLDRPVTKEDIINFFLTFMQQDQLGRIANLHLVMADQKELGTFDEVCVLLAELHSTAVDFSKTGIPVCT